MTYTIIRADRQQFIDVFLAKNSQLNLSSIRDQDGVFLKHIFDTLEIQNALALIQDDNKNTEKSEVWLFQKWQRVIDVGTGWGIPLLPLAIAYPGTFFTWLDSVRKKTEAVLDMAKQLWLKNVDVVWSRAEEYMPTQKFDILSARAVAFSDKLFTWTYDLVKKWWYFVLYKMFSEEEESRLDSYCRQRKMTMVRKHYYKLFEEDIQRVIYIIQK